MEGVCPTVMWSANIPLSLCMASLSNRPFPSMEEAWSSCMDRFESNIAYRGSPSPSPRNSPRPAEVMVALPLDIAIPSSETTSEAPTIDVRARTPRPMCALPDLPTIPTGATPDERLIAYLRWHDDAERVWASNEAAIIRRRGRIGCGGIPLVAPPPRPPHFRGWGTAPLEPTPYSFDVWIASCSRWHLHATERERRRELVLCNLR